MKKLLPLVMIMLSALFAAAQSITLSFTAADQNGSYHAFNSVKIENLTRNWQHTLNYPDTVVVLQVTDGVGEVGNQTDGLRLAGPNPFNGSTCADLELAEAGRVEVYAMQLDGKVVAHYDEYLSSGVHRVKFDAAAPQMYLLVAKTPLCSHTVKLMNTGNGSGNGIMLEKASVSVEKRGSKSREVGHFELGDQMRFTAYDGDGGSEELTQNQYESATITLTFNVDDPVSAAWFSVSDSKRVRFSHGNLQYQASTGTWRFAETQWTLVGESNSNISPDYSGWIDLFGWGTGSNPTNVSTDGNDYSTFTDWGINPISNGGNTANQWRTLTKDEWDYLLFTRATNSGIRFVKASVSYNNGFVIIPDDWDETYYTLNSVNTNNAYWSTNTIGYNDWMNIFEAHGAVFLPAGGYRMSSLSVSDLRGGGYYWSSTPNGDANAFYLKFSGSNLSISNYPRYLGKSVRLVADE